MTSRLVFLLLFWLFFGLTLFFWRNTTATYLRKYGENADFVIPTFLLSISGDWVKAVSVSRKTKSSLPIGIFLHGLFFVAMLTTVFVAAYFEVFDS